MKESQRLELTISTPNGRCYGGTLADYHDWVQVAFLFSLSVILYLILFAGVFVDTVLDMTRERIIDFIIS